MTIDRDHLRALDAAATPGPWETDDRDRNIRPAGPELPLAYDVRANDAALIVAARNALPALLDEIDRLEARLAVTVPMLPVETLYRSVPIDTRAEVEALPADALLRFSPPRALVPLEAHRQQGSDTVDPDAETAPSASAYRYVTPWQEPHP